MSVIEPRDVADRRPKTRPTEGCAALELSPAWRSESKAARLWEGWAQNLNRSSKAFRASSTFGVVVWRSTVVLGS